MEDVKHGRFREDLFYRLHVFPITVPPLRSRPEDVADLVRHFLARFGAEEGKRIRSVSAEAMTLLRAFSWPGNVRQLENAVFRAVVLAESDELGIAEFPHIAALAARLGPETTPAPREETPALLVPEAAPLLLDVEAPKRAAPAAVAPGPDAGPSLALLDAGGDVRPLEEIETETIRFAISHYRGQMSEVARRLRIGRSTLYRKLESLGIESDGDNSNRESVAGE
jgi:DNA-binding NtrC family response regulator